MKKSEELIKQREQIQKAIEQETKKEESELIDAKKRKREIFLQRMKEGRERVMKQKMQQTPSQYLTQNLQIDQTAKTKTVGYLWWKKEIPLYEEKDIMPVWKEQCLKRKVSGTVKKS